MFSQMLGNGLYKNSKGFRRTELSIYHLAKFTILPLILFSFNRQIVNFADFVNMHQFWVWHLTLIIFIRCYLLAI